jgi:hypothetical protein
LVKRHGEDLVGRRPAAFVKLDHVMDAAGSLARDEHLMRLWAST